MSIQNFEKCCLSDFPQKLFFLRYRKFYLPISFAGHSSEVRRVRCNHAECTLFHVGAVCSPIRRRGCNSRLSEKKRRVTRTKSIEGRDGGSKHIGLLLSMTRLRCNSIRINWSKCKSKGMSWSNSIVYEFRIMALIRVVSGSRSIDAVPVTLLFVFICRQRQFGGGGELFARLVWKLRLTHEGGARRDASLLLLSRKRSKLTRTFLSSYVHNSRSLAKQASYSLIARRDHPRAKSLEFR